MQLKEKALATTKSIDARLRRFRPSDRILAFLKSL
jgi:hypothetical protein